MKPTHRIDNRALCYNYDDDGIWNIKVTKNGITATMISNGIYSDEDEDYAPRVWKCRKDNRCKHKLSDREDGSYTIYPNRAGQPLYFYPIAS